MRTAIARILLSLLLSISLCLAWAQQPSSKPATVRQTPALQPPAQPTPDKQKGPAEKKTVHPCNPNTVGSAPCLPDITNLKGGIIIGGAPYGAGGKFVPWGTTADLSDLDFLPGSLIYPLETEPHFFGCSFNVTYEESNIGTADSNTNPPGMPPTTFTNSLLASQVGHALPVEVATTTGQHLNLNETKTVTVQVPLQEDFQGPSPERHPNRLDLSLNDGGTISESNYKNNIFTIHYTLECRYHPGIPGTAPIGGLSPKVKVPAANPNRHNRNRTAGVTANCDGLPDLISILPNPMNGVVMVKNIGKCPAGPSKLTVNCQKAGVVRGGGGCPHVPEAVIAPYQDPMFPNSATVSVPALAPGASFSHTFSFWPTLTWTSGTYNFASKADAANAVAESNEGNNVSNSVLVVP